MSSGITAKRFHKPQSNTPELVRLMLSAIGDASCDDNNAWEARRAATTEAVTVALKRASLHEACFQPHVYCVGSTYLRCMKSNIGPPYMQVNRRNMRNREAYAHCEWR